MKKSMIITCSLSTLALIAVVACGKSSDKKNEASVRPAVAGKNDGTAKSYDFSEKDSKGRVTCSAKQARADMVELCKALKDEDLNKKCAVKEREARATKEGCDKIMADASKAAKALPAAVPAVGFFEDKRDVSGTVTHVVRLMSEKVEMPTLNMPVTCLKSLSEIAEMKADEGLMLIGQAQVSMIRSEGTPEATEKPILVVTCDQKRDEKDKDDIESLGDLKVQVRKMKAGDAAISEVILVAKATTEHNDDIPKQSIYTNVACADSLVAAAIVKSDDKLITLKSGTRLLVKRDLDYKYASGKTSENLAPLSLIICE